MIKKIFWSLIFVTVGLLLLVTFFVQYQGKNIKIRDSFKSSNFLSKQSEQEVATDLFVHNSGAGTFERVGDEESDVYILTLQDFDDKVIYFTDRPLRDVGQVKLAQFLRGLSFEIGNPPNAAIVINTPEGEEMTVVAELTEPILMPVEGRLIFKAKVLKDNNTEQEAEYGGVIPKKFNKVTLLIDGCSKKDEKFCGSTGKCYNPQKEKCGGIKKSWKKFKNEKCHGMKLEDAYKYAQGPDSECLLYDKASLSEYNFTCDDKIKGWKIDLEINLTGEEGHCKAYCIVPAKESYKKNEGVGRIQYKCKKSANEKEPKNKYCPKPDVRKGYDNNKATKHLIEKYHSILNEATKHHTSYEHHYCVTSGMPYSTKKHWATDCSGLGGFALFDTLPYHYKLLDESRSAWTKADRPLATDFYEFIKKQPTEYHKDKNQCWQRIEKLKDAKQGDFLVAKYSKKVADKKHSTGHVMWIDEVHNKLGDHRKLTVIDSANNGHGSDTRTEDNTYNCKGSKTCGIGRGNIWVYPDDKGRPDSYTWKAHPGQKKETGEYLVIGRALNCSPE